MSDDAGESATDVTHTFLHLAALRDVETGKEQSIGTGEVTGIQGEVRDLLMLGLGSDVEHPAELLVVTRAVGDLADKETWDLEQALASYEGSQLPPLAAALGAAVHGVFEAETVDQLHHLPEQLLVPVLSLGEDEAAC